VLNDGTYILSAGDDGTGKGQAFVWEWRFGFKFKSFSCDDGDFRASAEFPQWRIFGLGCSDNFTTLYNWDSGTTVRLPFNAKTTKEIKDMIQGRVNAFRKTRLNGIERMAGQLAGQHAEFIKEKVLSANPGIADAEIAGENAYNFFHSNTFGAVNAFAYVPVRMNFATGHDDGRVRFWSSQTGMLVMVSAGHQGPVKALAASPVTSEVLSGGEDGTVRLWCLETGQQKKLFDQTYGGPVLALAVFPGGDRIAVGSIDGAIRIWDINTGIMLCQILGGNSAIRTLAINPSNPLGQILAAGEDGYVRVYNPK